MRWHGVEKIQLRIEETAVVLRVNLSITCGNRAGESEVL